MTFDPVGDALLIFSALFVISVLVVKGLHIVWFWSENVKPACQDRRSAI